MTSSIFAALLPSDANPVLLMNKDKQDGSIYFDNEVTMEYLQIYATTFFVMFVVYYSWKFFFDNIYV